MLVEGKLNANGYIKLLKENLLPFINQEMNDDDKYIFQEDNVTQHKLQKNGKMTMVLYHFLGLLKVQTSIQLKICGMN